ncbi:alpha/beta hydrolase [Eubacterium sp. 1001713B170207_170306_E7]|uniref:alpha/beta hydrolase n=1 Tax=Eubacterium sp. 1001713B170207_170306_E7 TaxID=2787097 RepID=UPI0018973D7D|nr:alpha/beta hydrolase [Eubacterium sp. 1001713B170207_170306_E7]
MNNPFIRRDIDFYSNGTRCSAWLYLPNVDKKCPVIVMAHGLGGVREMRLDAYAEKFATAGYACFLFDYRNFGASDGNERQKINVKDQLMDWNSAIDFIKKDDRVDGGKTLLFGSSFSGGHVITLSSKRMDIIASIAQCPYTNTLATMRTASPLSVIKALPCVIVDYLSCVTGYHPVMIKLADKRGKLAFMAVSDYKEFFLQIPQNSNFVNKTPARTFIEFLKYSPSRYTKNIESPIYYAVCKKDTLAPAKATLKCAKLSKKATIKEYNCGHFGIYIGEFFDKAIIDYIRFFDKIVK